MKQTKFLIVGLLIATITSISHNQIDQCKHCLIFIDVIQGIKDIKTLQKQFEKLPILICDQIRNRILYISDQDCHKFIDLYFPIIYDSLIVKFIRPERICQRLNKCQSSFKFDNIVEFKKRLLGNYSRLEGNKYQDRQVRIVKDQQESYKFMHLADTHFDYMYAENTNKVCDGPSCCRVSSNYTNHLGDYQPSGYWGAYNSTCDLPYRTMDKLIQNMLEQQKHQLDFIIWTGDSMDHFEQTQSQHNQTKNMKSIYQLIKKYDNQTTIFGIFGNHECYPESQCDLYTNKSQFLLDQSGELFKPELDYQGYQSLKQKGYYYQRIQSKRLKLIMINTQVCDLTNFYLIQNPTDPTQQLEWLIEQLQDSEDRQESVFIAGHIPPSNEWCDHRWQQRYSIIIERYQDTIKGQFFAHTHNDEISVMRTNSFNPIDKKQGTNIIYIAPSLTTFAIINPSYRVFKVGVNNQIIDYDQYRLIDLDVLNQQKENAVFNFIKQYSFKQEYDIKTITPQAVLQRLNVDDQTNIPFFIKYLSNFDTGLIDYDESIMQNQNKYIKRLCKVQYSLFQDQIDCEGLSFQFSILYSLLLLESGKNQLFIGLEYLVGKWFRLFDN